MASVHPSESALIASEHPRFVTALGDRRERAVMCVNFGSCRSWTWALDRCCGWCEHAEVAS